MYKGPSINLAMIHGGEVYNKVPDYCKMSLDIRTLPEQNIDDIVLQIKNKVDCKIIISDTGDPVKTDINSPYVKKLKNVASQFLDRDCILFGQHGSADTRFYSKDNILAVEFGSSGVNCHGNDEYVLIDTITKYKNILKQYVKTFQ
ncbi:MULTISPECIES: M20/M25/M40 family metallo-hydrolase [Clostridium]|uniref:Succinyl-diaminopimelate desuccinylase n=1 Tax=Clostridium coskatii TaxID=1705578 RepID=A0A162LCW0_9CLOT|nr:Peptidase dimerization domain protein [Clostridium autoethanogenum DSM 10061]OAA94272.1 putative succinyl-diaminopimelate desuccinylase [Clostridium coskatii]OBR95672.1 putative succinyl-diaminopimelate desuccinylase [Clostridium coskatii]OVY50492.1 putative succinyl-diaminopimelate desuccinylase [Clostridium autoethanogenum]